ncbi:hypothetical protein ACHAXT_011389 [Thalassiosira profunda]
MTSPSLTIGSIFLAYSPTLSLLFILVFRKPQLVILAVCSAFAYLVAALLSSLFWLATSAIGGAVNSGDANYGSSIAALMALAIPGVACQMLIRCLFVRGYFKVENVIRRSVAKHEEETAAAAAATGNNTSNGNAATTNGEANGTADTDAHAETNALQLQLNDLSCSLASGCGYALLHSLFLYGTLLASESGESGSYNDGGAYAGGGGSTGHGGTLYQESCGGMPSLVNGALIACLFSVLDVMWMMLSFYGMRRRSMPINATNAFESSSGTTMQNLMTGLACWGISDSPAGGNAAILLVSVTHLAASLVLAPNAREDGCNVSLPLLGGVVIWVALVLRKVAKKGFLPEDQRRRIQGMQLGLRTIGESHHVE